MKGYRESTEALGVGENRDRKKKTVAKALYGKQFPLPLVSSKLTFISAIEQ